MNKLKIYNSYVIFLVIALVHVAEPNPIDKTGCFYFEKLSAVCPPALDKFAENHTADLPDLKPTVDSWYAINAEKSVTPKPTQGMENNLQMARSSMVTAFNKIPYDEKKFSAYDNEMVYIQDMLNSHTCKRITVDMLKCPK